MNTSSIKFFITVDGPQQLNKANEGREFCFEENGISLYPDNIIPVIIRKVGCIGTGRVVKLEHTKDKTLVQFRMIEVGPDFDSDKMAAYYDAYQYFAQDNGLA